MHCSLGLAQALSVKLEEYASLVCGMFEAEIADSVLLPSTSWSSFEMWRNKMTNLVYLALLIKYCVISAAFIMVPSTFIILNSTPQILLCCSNNGHYDIVYPKTYPMDAALCQGELAVHQDKIPCVIHNEQSQMVNILFWIIGLDCNFTTVVECCMWRFHFFSALLYELLYSRVLGVEEEELQVALEGFKGGGRRYRNSQSMCSDDAGYDTPEDRPQRSSLVS